MSNFSSTKSDYPKEYYSRVKTTQEKVKIHELINFDKDSRENIKVSIVVPVCNVEEYLSECLDSCINQTLQDIEIICVNDGSKDNSLNILKEYAKKDYRVKIIDKENAGYGHAMNIGMDMARGEYIGIVESDDFVDINMYNDLYCLAHDNDLDIVKADFNRFIKNEEGKLKCDYIAVAARSKDCYNKIINPLENHRVFHLVMQTWSGIYKRTFIEANEIRHNETPGASYQDNGFWFQTFMFAKKVFFVDKPYYYNRRDNPNSSVYSKSKVYCINEEYDFIREIMSKYPELESAYLFEYSRKRFLNYLFNYNRLGPEFKVEYMNKFIKDIRYANEKQEIDWSLFTKSEEKDLREVLERPIEYMARPIVKREIEKTKNSVKTYNTYEIEKQNASLAIQNYDMWNSSSYRLGRGLTAWYRYFSEKNLIRQRYEESAAKNNICHLVFITDENYCMPTTVALTSIKQNQKDKTIYKVHIMASGISDSSKEKIMSLQTDRFVIELINVTQDERFKNYRKADGDMHVSPAAILKFRIPEILNKVGKVLYLDGDILVQDDLLELYNTNIKGKYAAVVKDIISERNPQHLKFLNYPYKYYFNSGMMLLNLTKMRKDNIGKKLVDYRLHGKNHFMDQDALNVILGNSVIFVSPRYNFLNKFYEWWDARQLSIFYNENLPNNEKMAFKYAVILHLGSKDKPWKYEMGYLSKLYDYYYKKSPYKNTLLARSSYQE